LHRLSSALARRVLLHFAGLSHRKELPHLVVFLHAKDHHMALLEAQKRGIPTMGIVDSDADASLLIYPIPANDDSLASQHFFLSRFFQALREGQQRKRASSQTSP